MKLLPFKERPFGSDPFLFSRAEEDERSSARFRLLLDLQKDTCLNITLTSESRKKRGKSL